MLAEEKTLFTNLCFYISHHILCSGHQRLARRKNHGHANTAIITSLFEMPSSTFFINALVFPIQIPCLGPVFSAQCNNKHHLTSRSMFVCTRASFFSFPRLFSRHINAVHLDLRPYSCTECVAKFKKRAHLQRHMSTCHRSSSSQ